MQKAELIHTAGFEPTLPKKPEFKYGALDRSATYADHIDLVSLPMIE